MYYNLGFDNWTFEIDQTRGKQIADRLREVWTKYPEAKENLSISMKKVDKIYEDRMDLIKRPNKFPN